MTNRIWAAATVASVGLALVYLQLTDALVVFVIVAVMWAADRFRDLMTQIEEDVRRHRRD